MHNLTREEYDHAKAAAITAGAGQAEYGLLLTAIMLLHVAQAQGGRSTEDILQLVGSMLDKYPAGEDMWDALPAN